MIYIQSNRERTLPHHFDCACALYGAMDSGLKYRLTSYEEIMEKPMIYNNVLMKNNLFVGSVEFMRDVFKRMGLEDVRVPLNSDRPTEISTLKQAHERVAKGEKLFVKSYDIKLFTGLVLDGATYTCLKGVPDDTKVIAYPPFKNKILSEWRLYVHKNEIIYSANYSGDFRLTPDYSSCERQLIRWKIEKFPCAYTIDLALFVGHQEICEFNDGWAIGSYGIPNDMYLKFLTDRYFEIVK